MAGRSDEAMISRIAWDLDWNLLRTFMVIAQKGSITQAAAALQLKQPTLSNALKRLEESLQCSLADRGPRTFTLTRQGAALYRECLDIFGSIGRLPNALSADEVAVAGHVSIVMASHVASPMFDEVLSQFHTENPKATLSLSVQSSAEVVETVAAKQATFGVCLLREEKPDLDITLFYREHFGFFCGPTHPLFGVEDLSVADLRGQQRVSFSTDKLGDVLHPIAVLRGRAQFGDKVTGLSNNLEEVRRMIMAGLGIGPLPIHVVERDIVAGRLWQLPPYNKLPEIDIYMVSNSRAKMNRAEQAFLTMLQKRITATPLTERTYGNPK